MEFRDLPPVITSRAELVEFVINSLENLSARIALVYKDSCTPSENTMRKWEAYLLNTIDLIRLVEDLRND